MVSVAYNGPMRNPIRYEEGRLVSWPQSARFEVMVTRVSPCKRDIGNIVVTGRVRYSRGAPPLGTTVRLSAPLDKMPDEAADWAERWKRQGINLLVTFETDAEGRLQKAQTRSDLLKRKPSSKPSNESPARSSAGERGPAPGVHDGDGTVGETNRAQRAGKGRSAHQQQPAK